VKVAGSIEAPTGEYWLQTCIDNEPEDQRFEWQL